MVQENVVSISFSHIEATKILIPALEVLVARVHDLTGDSVVSPYAEWVRESGFALLERLRQETLAIPWGEGLLRIPLDADALGLLAAALGALRLRSNTQADRSMTAALEEARQRL